MNLHFYIAVENLWLGISRMYQEREMRTLDGSFDTLSNWKSRFTYRGSSRPAFSYACEY
jgi:hypothetical protein